MGLLNFFFPGKTKTVKGVPRYSGGTIFNPTTGRTYSSDARAELLNSTQTVDPTLQLSEAKYNAPQYTSNNQYSYPTYLQNTIERAKKPQLKGHYRNEDVKKVDAEIVLLTQAVSDMYKTLTAAQNTAPHLLEQNQPLLQAFNKASDYALKQGFSLDQFAVNDRLDKYGYHDSSSKLGAMVNLANKRVGAYIENELKKAQLPITLKESYMDSIRKNMDTLSNVQPMLNDNRKTILDTISNTDIQEAENLNRENLIRSQDTSNLNSLRSRDAENLNALKSRELENLNMLRNRDAAQNTETQLANEKLKFMRQDLFSKIDSDMYNKLLKSKELQDLNYEPDKKTKNKNIFGQALGAVGRAAAGAFIGGPVGGFIGGLL